MEIAIDNEQIEKSINDNITQAINGALSGYSVKAAVSECITKEVASGLIGNAISAAVANINAGSISQTLAREMERAVTSAVVNLMREGVANVIMSIRGKSEYSEGYKQMRAEVIEAIKRGN